MITRLGAQVFMDARVLWHVLKGSPQRKSSKNISGIQEARMTNRWEPGKLLEQGFKYHLHVILPHNFLKLADLKYGA